MAVELKILSLTKQDKERKRYHILTPFPQPQRIPQPPIPQPVPILFPSPPSCCPSACRWIPFHGCHLVLKSGAVPQMWPWRLRNVARRLQHCPLLLTWWKHATSCPTTRMYQDTPLRCIDLHIWSTLHLSWLFSHVLTIWTCRMFLLFQPNPTPCRPRPLDEVPSGLVDCARMVFTNMCHF